MKTKILRNVAVTLGIGACGWSSLTPAIAQAPGGFTDFFKPGSSQPVESGMLVPPSAPSYAQQKAQGFGPNQGFDPAQAAQFAGGQVPTVAAYQTATRSPQPGNQAQPPTQNVTSNGLATHNGYQAPAKWDSFNRDAQQNVNQPQQSPSFAAGLTQPNIQTVSNAEGMGIPAPMPDFQSHPPQDQPIHQHGPQTQSTIQGDVSHDPAAVAGADCQSCNTGSPSPQSATAPWSAENGYSMIGSDCGPGACGAPLAPVRPQIFPWFGGFNLLFLNFENNGKHVLGINDGMPALWSSAVDPQNSLGFDLSFGRYLACGQYGIGATFFRFDPDEEMSTITGMPDTTVGGTDLGSMRPAMQGYHDYHMSVNYDGSDPDGAGPLNAGDPVADQVYNIVTGATGPSLGAAAIRARRDVEFNGIEVNLFSFGLMGARRAAPLCGDGLAQNNGLRHFMGLGPAGGAGVGHGAPAFGFGGAAGPLVRPSTGRFQVVTSHGFRWLEFTDKSELAYDVNGMVNYQDNDIYDFSCVENNLYGYQFGGRLVCCLTNRVNVGVGSKFGVYGNNVEAYRRVGSADQVAYRSGMPSDTAETQINDTFLATLGELDLGLGYRLSNCWTLRGGYRVIGITGVATAFNQASRSFGTSHNPGHIYADESIFLHGAYVGADYNF